MDTRNKEEFVFFTQRALADTSSDSYIELYNILQRAFVAADIDFDGKVSEDEFSCMIEAAAALPKKFGYSWWPEDKAAHGDLFKKIDENNDGAVSFDEWLSFAISHYKSKASELPKSLEDSDKDGFVKDCKGASDAASDSYKKLYWFHWKCFQAADADRDGMVAAEEFDKMIEMATATQKKLGLPAPFGTADERSATFKKMDENGDGHISFDEWLDFSLKEIIAKVAAL